MIIEIFNETLEEIRKEQEIIKETLIGGTLKNFEEYKFLCGKFNGYLEAEQKIKEKIRTNFGNIKYI
ncbi:MAG TPA: hypothetical protein VHA52_10025 [Candidatus Babeliaceae bacterium]|nr:hypothetical protein [Candidatus Babeliaceae bacterium]